MAMITCRECGKQISDTADICPHCGAKVNQITVKSSASSKHLIIYVTLIILGAFVFFVGLGIFFDDINTYYPHYNYRSPLTSHESQVISTMRCTIHLSIDWRTYLTQSIQRCKICDFFGMQSIMQTNWKIILTPEKIIGNTFPNVLR